MILWSYVEDKVFTDIYIVSVSSEQPMVMM